MAGVAERTLALRLIADVGDISKGLGRVDRRLGRTARAAASWGKALGGALIIGGLERLADSAVEGVRAFREEQDAARNFNRTVRNLGMPVKGATKALDAMADSAVSLGFDDADMIRGMDRFVKMTRSITDAQRAMSLAMDIARGRNISLEQAQREVEGIFAGSARTLRRYGLSGVKGMEAVSEAAKRERGKARAWARHHPMEVLLGRISDGWADVVGNLSQGNLGAAMKAGAKLAANIARGITGYTTKDGKRVRGLWDRLFDSTPDKQGRPKGIISRLGQDIADAVAGVDWGKALGDALAAGLDGLKGLISSGGITQVAAVGGAIAAGMFAIDLFLAAAKLVLTPSGWLDLAGGVAKATGAVLGWGLRAGMFVADKFITAMSGVIGAIDGSGKVQGKARSLGRGLGRGIGGGLLASLASVLGVPLVAGGVGAIIGAAMVLIPTWLTQPENRLPVALKASAQQARSRGARNGSIVERQLRQSFPDATDEQIRQALREAGFEGYASGTPSARRGWAWVGERGPELVRFRGGEQVLPHPASMAAAGGGGMVVNVTVNGYVGSEAQLARELNRILSSGVQRGMRLGYR